MLVVTLREDEFINVSGGPVTITLVKVSGKQVRIGIACAREHEIHRSNDNRRQTPLIPLVGQLERSTNMTEQPETDPKVRLMVLRATAVRAAMNEIMNEQRDEIIRRARAKLAAMGVSVADAEGSDGDAKLP